MAPAFLPDAKASCRFNTPVISITIMTKLTKLFGTYHLQKFKYIFKKKSRKKKTKQVECTFLDLLPFCPYHP